MRQDSPRRCGFDKAKDFDTIMNKAAIVLKTGVSIALSCVYFGVPCIFSKFPPIIWNALCCNHDKYGVLVAVGLVFGSGGDVLLDINGDISFMMGMLSFGIGHVFDIYAFFQSNPQRSNLCLIASVLYCILMMILIIPYVSVAMIVPVILYGIVLCAAAYVSAIQLLSGDDTRSRSSKWLALSGSIVFLVSDTLLAFEIFRGTNSSFISKYAIMLTYYVAQLFIALSSYIDPPSSVALSCCGFGAAKDDEGKRLIDSEGGNGQYEPPIASVK